MNALEYTNQELEKQLNLLENHLKQTSYDKDFCAECIRKHTLTIEGLAEEGIGFSHEPEKYAEMAQLSREIRDRDIGDAIEVSRKVREIRKSLRSCSTCGAAEKITKYLNTPETFSNHKLNLTKNKMVDYTELGMMNAGQFAAEGARYLVETYKPEWDKYVSIGGGIGLQVLGLFVKQLPDWAKTLSIVAGSNMLANGVVKIARGAITPTASVRRVASNGSPVVNVGGYSGKSFSVTPSFGGPTFGGRVTAENIPTRYARAGILSGAQAFEAPEHADLIRVD